MASTPGQGTTFDEYFGDDGDWDCVESGSMFGVEYRVRRYRRGGEASHYGVYVGFPSDETCKHMLCTHRLPPTPGHGGLTFGPTTDYWVGWGTLDGRDYNLFADGTKFGCDRRISEDQMQGMVDTSSPSWWTPERLVRATEEWIVEARFAVTAYSCRICG